MKPYVGRARSWAWLAVLAVAVFGLAACEGDDDPLTVDGVTVTTDPPERLPEWLLAVSPPPGGEAPGIQTVEVDARVTTGVRQVRLEVDGVDVTAYATEPQPADPTDQQVTRPNRLVYDPKGIPEDPPGGVTDVDDPADSQPGLTGDVPRDEPGDVGNGEEPVTDPDQRQRADSVPVDLEPGPHFATVRLIEFPEGLEADEAVEVDSFTWSFEIL